MSINLKLDSMKRQEKDLETKAHGIQSRIGDKKKEIDHLKSELQSRQADLLKLENEYAQAEAGIKHMQVEIESEIRAQELKEKSEREARQHEKK